MTANNVTQRRALDPAALTPMEQKIYDLRQQGLTYTQMAEAMGGKWTRQNIYGKMKIIREKLACR